MVTTLRRILCRLCRTSVVLLYSLFCFCFAVVSHSGIYILQLLALSRVAGYGYLSSCLKKNAPNHSGRYTDRPNERTNSVALNNQCHPSTFRVDIFAPAKCERLAMVHSYLDWVFGCTSHRKNGQVINQLVYTHSTRSRQSREFHKIILPS